MNSYARRYGVVFALFLLTMITYVDRVCISTAKDPIAAELKLSDSEMGVIFSLFALGYAFAQIPAGWFADKMGPRVALAVVVTCWSALTALTGFAWSFVSLGAIRLLFGVAEAGAFPGCARAVRNWLPVSERGRANGALLSGSRLGAAVSYPLLAWMLTRWQWRESFLWLGIGGMVWVLVWILWFRDWPEGAAAVAIEPVAANEDFGRVFRSRPMALAMTQYFASNFTFFICLSWMLPYLKRQYHLADFQAASYSMIPLLVGATSQWFAGWLVDRVYRSSWRAWSRRASAMIGFTLAAAGLLLVTTASTPGGAVLFFTLAVFGSDMTVSPSWVFCTDIAGRNTGGVSGAMNMLGSIGSFVSANAFPYLQKLTGSASAYFVIAAALNVIGIVCWFHMRMPEREVAL